MEEILYSTLKILFQNKAINIRDPKFGDMPFEIHGSVLETNPECREAIFKILSGRIDKRAHGVVLQTYDDVCIALGAIFADRLGLPFVLPWQAAPSDNAAIIFHGHQKREQQALLLNVYTPPIYKDKPGKHPVIRTIQAAQSVHGGKIAKLVCIFDADKDHVIRMNLANLKVVYDSVYDMSDVLRIVLASPDDFGTTHEKALAALKHYEHM